jgi:hypothetical protein
MGLPLLSEQVVLKEQSGQVRPEKNGMFTLSVQSSASFPRNITKNPSAAKDFMEKIIATFNSNPEVKKMYESNQLMVYGAYVTGSASNFYNGWTPPTHSNSGRPLTGTYNGCEGVDKASDSDITTNKKLAEQRGSNFWNDFVKNAAKYNFKVGGDVKPIIRGIVKDNGCKTDENKKGVDLENYPEATQMVYVKLTVGYDKTRPVAPSIQSIKFTTYREPQAKENQSDFYGFDQDLSAKTGKPVTQLPGKILTRNAFFGYTDDFSKERGIIKAGDNYYHGSGPSRIMIVPVGSPITDEFKIVTKKSNKEWTVKPYEQYKLTNQKGGDLTPFQWAFAKKYITGGDGKKGLGTSNWDRIINKPNPEPYFRSEIKVT